MAFDVDLQLLYVWSWRGAAQILSFCLINQISKKLRGPWIELICLPGDAQEDAENSHQYYITSTCDGRSRWTGRYCYGSNALPALSSFRYWLESAKSLRLAVNHDGSSHPIVLLSSPTRVPNAKSLTRYSQIMFSMQVYALLWSVLPESRLEGS